jgi:hypothetical protein
MLVSARKAAQGDGISRTMFNNDNKERNMPDNKQDPQNSVEEQIRSLRQKAESGELGDEVLEDVAGGTASPHTDGVIHVDNP